MKKLQLRTESIKNRNSSIELLRIICMFMIVFHHFARHGEFQFFDYELTLPKLWYNFIIMGGKIGVNIFVLISGYFLINNKTLFNFQRIKKTWDQVFFYSVVFEVFFVFLYFIIKQRLDLSNLLNSFFPITTSQWWFASTYFVLYLMHPFINKTLLSISKKTYQGILLSAAFCWCIIPTFTKSGYESNSHLWFAFLYSLSGYIKLYGFNPKIKNYHYAISALIASVIMYLSSVFISFLGTKIPDFNLPSNYFYSTQSLTVFLVSVCLFMTFATTSIKINRIIKTIASATFGVYLIHENHFLRNIFWQTVFKNANYQNTLKLIPVSVVAVVIVYIVCTIIELIRQVFIEKTFSKITDILLMPFKKFLLLLTKHASALFNQNTQI
ncbi:MAG: acyltransferase [Clostridia bacterium]|nr:acyltransferase [Clostridia bacterium]